ncbi:hypothetical protein [Flavobacterium pectinovorum]|uniref:hypothetical protein n=1 Tax=Flavobacterium pectinovorum TaxID=29533 RepID=UPI001FAD9A16|nr:hypothetical protein [Flavobacterium pectinovorum]MCI9845640.1 hypothetical protein [Flavobacterium pectinovorum]
METVIRIFIYIHAFFGGIGLVAGMASILLKKGNVLHQKAGKIFSVSMIVNSLIILPICWMPKHQNIFLFLIGIFTIYLVLSGNRALNYRFQTNAEWIDKLLSGSMLFFSLIMLLLGAYSQINNIVNGILFTIFGAIGAYLSIKDFIFYKNFSVNNKKWLVKHAGMMTGAFTASITAFIVAGLNISNLIVWIAPGILGGIYTFYWSKKLSPKKKHQQENVLRN